MNATPIIMPRIQRHSAVQPLERALVV